MEVVVARELIDPKGDLILCQDLDLFLVDGWLALDAREIARQHLVLDRNLQGTLEHALGVRRGACRQRSAAFCAGLQQRLCQSSTRFGLRSAHKTEPRAQFPVTLPVTGELATPTFLREGVARLKSVSPPPDDERREGNR
jgi:hypothetical protein